MAEKLILSIISLKANVCNSVYFVPYNLMSHLAIAMLAIMVICEAEDETADMTFAGLLRGAEKTCQLKNPGRIPV